MNLYRQLVILGPFFAESRITYSHFLSVEFKANDTWSPPRQIGKEHFLAYVENPWQFNKLSYLGYERYLVTSVASLGTNRPFEEVQQGVAFRELNEVLMTEFIKTSVDSIRIVYGLNHYTPATGSYALDTVFIHTYNPDTIGKAKK